MVNPPAVGTTARKEVEAEKAAILASLRKRAHMMTDGFNSLEGVTCNVTEGAMYSFPQLHLPAKAIAAAKAAGKAPTTSAKPPVLTKGTHSDATDKTLPLTCTASSPLP